jgi:Ni/Fe-hydrogenase subunit HybB-like protein
MEHLIPKQIKTVKFFSPGVLLLLALAVNGLVFLGLRLAYGIGSVTNLDNQYPWGLWIAIDVAAGVALAAGGFTSAAIGHVLHKERYHIIVRPALLTAMLGYTFVAMGVCIDIGRWYYIWHPLIMWNGTSALFEVGICVMIYLTVLYIEFIPVVTERFIGKVNLPSIIKFLNSPIDRLLRFMDKFFAQTMFLFIIAGIVLSTLHQSSLGTLMVIADAKMHPLWSTPILPLLFLLSAICVGFPMVIFESLLASRSFKLEPEMSVLSHLGSLVTPILSIYLAFKIGDMVIRESFVYLKVFNKETIFFLIEMVVGLIIPLIMFAQKKVLRSPSLLFIAAFLVVFGVILNRFNSFITAYHPPYATQDYFPSIGEFSVTIGFISLLVLFYRAVVMIFPVIGQPDHRSELAKEGAK